MNLVGLMISPPMFSLSPIMTRGYVVSSFRGYNISPYAKRRYGLLFLRDNNIPLVIKGYISISFVSPSWFLLFFKKDSPLMAHKGQYNSLLKRTPYILLS